MTEFEAAMTWAITKQADSAWVVPENDALHVMTGWGHSAPHHWIKIPILFERAGIHRLTKTQRNRRKRARRTRER